MSAKKLLKKSWTRNRHQAYSNKISLDELINADSELGRTLFGPIPEGHQREFFAGKRNVWFWYESWTDAAGALQEMTLRYEVRPTGVYMKPAGGSYRKIEGDELNNFCKAVRGYLDLVKRKLYC